MSGHLKPRSWFAMFWRDGGWISILLACATIVLTGVSISQYAQARTVAQDGIVMWATVTERRISETDAGTQYFVTYLFTVEGQKKSIEMQVLPSDYAEAATPLHKVPYPTDNPELISEREDGLLSEGRKFGFFALLLGVMGLLMGCLSGQNATSAVLARRQGTEEDAYIYERVESISTDGPSTVYIKFRSHSGAEGRSFSRLTFTFPALDRGDMIRVFTRNGRAWWVNDTGARPEMPKRLPIVRRWRRRGEH